jgi:hypothetical protein
MKLGLEVRYISLDESATLHGIRVRRRSDRQVWVVSGYAFLDEVGKEKRREATPSKQSIVFHLLKRAAVVRQYM